MVWYLQSVIIGAITTHMVEGILAAVPSPLMPLARAVMNYTLVISVWGITFTFTWGAIVGFFVRSWLGF